MDEFQALVYLNSDVVHDSMRQMMDIKPAVFFCPPAGGWAFPYFYIALHFDSQRPLYAFQVPQIALKKP